MKFLMLQAKNRQDVRQRQSTKVGPGREGFQKEGPTQRQRAGGDTGAQTQLPKYQIREDESICILLLLFIVQV